MFISFLREFLEHKVQKFNDNATVSVIPHHPLTWVEELSEGNKEEDTLFLVNIALLVSSDLFFFNY